MCSSCSSLLRLSDDVIDDGSKLTCSEIYSYLCQVMYHKRCKVQPLWNAVLVGGRLPESTTSSSPSSATSSASATASAPEPADRNFLGYVDMYGTHYVDNYIATGYGSYLAIPLLRKRWKADMTQEEAKDLLFDCMRVLIYRDCRTINNVRYPLNSAVCSTFCVS